MYPAQNTSMASISLLIKSERLTWSAKSCVIWPWPDSQTPSLTGSSMFIKHQSHWSSLSSLAASDLFLLQDLNIVCSLCLECSGVCLNATFLEKASPTTCKCPLLPKHSLFHYFCFPHSTNHSITY